MSTSDNSSMNNDIWSAYATSFSRITTRYQSTLYRDIAALAQGHVVDFGCGPAKLAPYLASRASVTGYLGVDACPLMVQLGRQLLDELTAPGFAVTCSTIETLSETGFSFGVSVNSYYVWQSPVIVLEKIRDCLAAGADFILATPNDRLDMNRLMQDSRQDFLLSPDFQQFKECNDRLAQSHAYQFVTLDTLISQLRSVGFSILHCHTDYFDGGLNFIHARKMAGGRR